jgi:hypothetical protein
MIYGIRLQRGYMQSVGGKKGQFTKYNTNGRTGKVKINKKESFDNKEGRQENWTK